MIGRLFFASTVILAYLVACVVLSVSGVYIAVAFGALALLGVGSTAAIVITIGDDEADPARSLSFLVLLDVAFRFPTPENIRAALRAVERLDPPRRHRSRVRSGAAVSPKMRHPGAYHTVSATPTQWVSRECNG